MCPFDGLFMMRQFESGSQLHAGSSRAAALGGGLTTWLLGWLEVMLILCRNTPTVLNICALASRERESSALKS